MKLKTIIVIDDDLDDLDIMSDVIATVEPESNCITFKDPQTAVGELLSNQHLLPDYIFIDYNMPLMSGDECLEKLRQCQRLSDAIIVMISTSMPEIATSKLYDAGANYAVEKPSRLSNYYTLFKSIFRNHR